MDKMELLLKKNKDLVKKIAEKNTHRDKNGHIVISVNDPWAQDTIWSSYYEELRNQNGTN